MPTTQWDTAENMPPHQGVYVARLRIYREKGTESWYYVGSSRDVRARCLQHKEGGAASCAFLRHLKESVAGTGRSYELTFSVAQGQYAGNDAIDLETAETRETLLQMLVHGMDGVRGGAFSETTMTDEHFVGFKRDVCHYGGLCFYCGLPKSMRHSCRENKNGWHSAVERWGRPEPFGIEIESAAWTQTTAPSKEGVSKEELETTIAKHITEYARELAAFEKYDREWTSGQQALNNATGFGGAAVPGSFGGRASGMFGGGAAPAAPVVSPASAVEDFDFVKRPPEEALAACTSMDMQWSKAIRTAALLAAARHDSKDRAAREAKRAEEVREVMAGNDEGAITKALFEESNPEEIDWNGRPLKYFRDEGTAGLENRTSFIRIVKTGLSIFSDGNVPIQMPRCMGTMVPGSWLRKQIMEVSNTNLPVFDANCCMLSLSEVVRRMQEVRQHLILTEGAEPIPPWTPASTVNETRVWVIAKALGVEVLFKTREGRKRDREGGEEV